MNPILNPWLSVALHVLIRFGRWYEIIAEPFMPFYSVEYMQERPQVFQFTLVTLLYAKAIAYSVIAGIEPERSEECLSLAEKCIEEFEEKYQLLSKNRFFFNNSHFELMDVSHKIMKGEFLYRKQQYSEAFDFLRQANKLYDSLHYDEPWGSIIPTRHISAALLLEEGIRSQNQKLIEEAERDYRVDLGMIGDFRAIQHPNNVWSLVGLIRCCEQLKKPEEIKELQQKLQSQLQYSDIQINASCLCSVKKVSSF